MPIVEELTTENFYRLIRDDLAWIDEVIKTEGKLFSQKTKQKAQNLSDYINENKAVFYKYFMMREEILSYINDRDNDDPNQLEMILK